MRVVPHAGVIRGAIIAGVAALAMIGGGTLAAPRPTAKSKNPVGAVKLPVLSYTIDRAGPAEGAHPKRSDAITVNYTLTLLDGSVVDSSVARGEPAVFPLNRLIPAWQVLIQLMRPGDAWTFYVPPEYAYGSAARDKLPSNSLLIFKVELVSFTTPPAEAK